MLEADSERLLAIDRASGERTDLVRFDSLSYNLIDTYEDTRWPRTQPCVFSQGCASLMTMLYAFVMPS